MVLVEYLKALIFGGLCLGVGLFLVGLAFLRAPSRPNTAKSSPYECGFPPLSPLHQRLDVRFVRVAILFILFDVEVIFLFPWALHLRELGWWGFASVCCFLGILALGLVYEWAKGALDWS